MDGVQRIECPECETMVNVPERRIRFGPNPNQSVPAEWAERMLTELASSKRTVFGTLLSRAAIGAES